MATRAHRRPPLVALTATVPFPPLELANRVGSLAEADDPFAFYDALGRGAKESLLSVLPDDWTFDGKHVLDFGCGAGRTLRHFIPEATAAAKFWGCDIDAESVHWIAENLPQFEVFTNDELPPLPLATESLDLIYAISVFTHLTSSWSGWLLELHRALARDGLLIATFINEGASRYITDEPWDERRTGMTVLRPGQSWDLGGPMVLHSEWWIRAHWGRAFDIVSLDRSGFGTRPGVGQGIVLMRKRDVALLPEDLERPEPDEPRELEAALHAVEQLTRELVELRASHDELAAAWRGEQSARADAERRARELHDAVVRVETSRSWRLTQPLRKLAASARRRA